MIDEEEAYKVFEDDEREQTPPTIEEEDMEDFW